MFISWLLSFSLEKNIEKQKGINRVGCVGMPKRFFSFSKAQCSPIPMLIMLYDMQAKALISFVHCTCKVLVEEQSGVKESMENITEVGNASSYNISHMF